MITLMRRARQTGLLLINRLDGRKRAFAWQGSNSEARTGAVELPAQTKRGARNHTGIDTSNDP